MPAPRTALPLATLRIAVTRTPEQAGELIARLSELGAVPLLCPAIAFAPPADSAPLERALHQIGGYDWAIFTSANAVRFTLARAAAIGVGLEQLAGPRLAAVGRSTAAALQQHQLQPALVPEAQHAEGLLHALGGAIGAGQRALLPAGDLARSTLAEGLRARGAHADCVVAYRTIPGDGARLLAPYLAAAAIDATIFASPSAVTYLLDGLAQAGIGRSAALERLGTAICIGPTTAEAARAAGLRVAQAREGPSVESIIQALVAR